MLPENMPEEGSLKGDIGARQREDAVVQRSLRVAFVSWSRDRARLATTSHIVYPLQYSIRTTFERG